MMSRENAYRVCERAVVDNRRLLQQMVGRPKHIPLSHTMLIGVRDRLDRACRAFVEQLGDDDHEDLYMPLVDALGLINSALTQNDINRNYVSLAFERLESLLDVLASEDTIVLTA